MKEVVKYISNDGREFVDREKCIAYEALCKEVAEAMSKLTPIPDLPGCGFQNGDGYLQHDPEIAKSVRAKILTLANIVMPHRWFVEALEVESVHPSYPERLIGEMDEKCIRNAWNRFYCMTKDFREYGQPYFAAHPSEAKDICLNEKA